MPLHRRATLGHISVCIHLTNTRALQEIHYVLSWQSSKHSRDVFSGFVFPVFTKRLGQSYSEAQDAGHHSSSSEVYGSSVEEKHTATEGKLIWGVNSVRTEPVHHFSIKLGRMLMANNVSALILPLHRSFHRISRQDINIWHILTKKTGHLCPISGFVNQETRLYL